MPPFIAAVFSRLTAALATAAGQVRERSPAGEAGGQLLDTRREHAELLFSQGRYAEAAKFLQEVVAEME
jgi:hypothetical protein